MKHKTLRIAIYTKWCEVRKLADCDTIEKLAKNIGISAGLCSNILSGKHKNKLKIQTREKLAAWLDVDVHDVPLRIADYMVETAVYPHEVYAPGVPYIAESTSSSSTSDLEVMREQILGKVEECVLKDRLTKHGDPEDNFKLIGELWSTYLKHEITPKDVAVMMSLLKIARIATGEFNIDNYVDLAGYAICGGELHNKEDRRY